MISQFCKILLFLILLFPVVALAGDHEDHVVDMKIDDATHTIIVFMDDDFANRKLTLKSVSKIYKSTTKGVHKALPKTYKDYNVRIMSRGVAIESLIGTQNEEQASESKRDDAQKGQEKRQKRHGGWWGDIAYDGKPWVRNISLPHNVTEGLKDIHISLWASHGRYYDKAKGYWKWQRPNMFCTNEDLFTQTIVVPYLIPMLEKAGAVVFTPRERDWQKAEVIVDNDNRASGYSETQLSGAWKRCPEPGFAMPDGVIITDTLNPFTIGTIRQTATSRNADDASTATYQPSLETAGRYAVYVSYATVDKSIDDVLYSVYHKGKRTDFHVNQRMGGGTWVYLGTFDFDAGSNEYNKVVLSAYSKAKGVVTTDAVRFGGGMGNIQRGGSVSGLPRCLEGARYYAQWAGVPYSLYSLYKGDDDYKDDINVRSLMTNWLAGGSPFVPDKAGKKVPIDLSLAIHSDAGYNKNMKSVYGSLAICTTDFNDGKLSSGISRSHSTELAQQLLDNSKRDLQSRYGEWAWRDLYDRNYSETRLPAMPSAIFETLSHQSFPDMTLAHDPDFKFTLARSIYKTILRYEAKAHGTKAVVMPLPPVNFSVTTDNSGRATLSWVQQFDKEEPTATPTSYNVYTAMGNMGYDNGTNISQTKCSIVMEKDVVYRFRITAVNSGGESFPTEELCAVWHGPGSKNILVINGFQRLAAPSVRNDDMEKGFDIDHDPGLSYGLTAGWSGKQQTFSTSTAGSEGVGTFGYSGNEMVGNFVAGNDFNYVAQHVEAIASANQYNVVSCTRTVAEWGDISLANYDCIDLLLGNERYDGYSLQTYKTFTKQLQNQLFDYKRRGCGAILVSGSYIGSDMQQEDEKDFLRQMFGLEYTGSITGDNATATGLGMTLSIINDLNADHYATTHSDVIVPAPNPYAPATAPSPFIAMQYGNGSAAAVASRGTTPTFAMAFPFECIKSPEQRALVMRGILGFLIP